MVQIMSVWSLCTFVSTYNGVQYVALCKVLKPYEDILYMMM